jgi:hypothetical protein
MALASLEEMESNDTSVSTEGNRVFDLVREGKMNCTVIQKYFLCLNCAHTCTCLDIKYML